VTEAESPPTQAPRVAETQLEPETVADKKISQSLYIGLILDFAVLETWQ